MSKSAMETMNNDFSQLEPFSRLAVIQDLPNEVLEHIFGFLNIKERIRTELVCSRWRDIGANGQWNYPTKIDFTDIRKLQMKWEGIPITDDVVLAILSRCGKSVKKVKVSTVLYNHAGLVELKDLTNKVLCVIGDNCPNLVEIRMEVPKNECLDYLINLAQKCSKLKKVFIVAPWLNDDILSTFLKRCHSLEYLHLGDNWQLSEDWQLTDGNWQLTGDFVDSLKMDLKGLYFSYYSLDVENVFERLVKRCHHIAELAIDWPLNCFAPLNMVLSYYNTTLKNLSLECCEIKPSEWYCIPDVIPQLEVLSLKGAKGVDDHLIKILAEKCKKLKSLNLASTCITKVGVGALASAPSLTELNLVDIQEATSEGIESLATQGRLEKFAVSITLPDCLPDPYWDNSNLEERCISLVKCCPNLRILILSGQNITDRLVDKINSSLESGLLKGSVSLYVSYTKVTRNVKCCPKLTLFFSFEDHDVFSCELNFIARRM